MIRLAQLSGSKYLTSYRTGIAEGVRQPDFLGVHAELLGEKLLAHQELSGHRLTAGHVGVRFHPHSTDRDELPGYHLGPNSLEQRRVIVFDPGELLRRRAGENEIGIV